MIFELKMKFFLIAMCTYATYNAITNALPSVINPRFNLFGNFLQGKIFNNSGNSSVYIEQFKASYIIQIFITHFKTHYSVLNYFILNLKF